MATSLRGNLLKSIRPEKSPFKAGGSLASTPIEPVPKLTPALNRSEELSPGSKAAVSLTPDSPINFKSEPAI